jgi:hypothetical protein
VALIVSVALHGAAAAVLWWAPPRPARGEAARATVELALIRADAVPRSAPEPEAAQPPPRAAEPRSAMVSGPTRPLASVAPNRRLERPSATPTLTPEPSTAGTSTAPAPPPSRWSTLRRDPGADGPRVLDLRPRLRSGEGLGPPPDDGAAALDLFAGAYDGTVRTPNMAGAGQSSWHETIGDPAGGGRYRARRSGFTGEVREDGSVVIRDNPNWDGELFADRYEGVGYRAVFDLTDWLMRMHGEDPYLYNKMKWLDDTRDERMAMAVIDRGRKLRQAVWLTSELLAEVWNDPHLEPKLRRRALFLLWDECAEDGTAEVLRASAEVRATIVGFVRKVAPKGSDLAYGADELEALNATRESRALFDPYEIE